MQLLEGDGLTTSGVVASGTGEIDEVVEEVRIKNTITTALSEELRRRRTIIIVPDKQVRDLRPPVTKDTRLTIVPFESSEFIFVDKALMSSVYADKIQRSFDKFVTGIPAIVNCDSNCDPGNPIGVSVLINFDFNPMLFGLFKGRVLEGSFLMFNITIKSQTQDLLEISTSFGPALPGLGTGDWDVHTTKILQDLLNKPLARKDSTQVVKIVEWLYPPIVGREFRDTIRSNEYLTTITREDQDST